MFRLWIKSLLFGGGLPVTLFVLFCAFWVLRGRRRRAARIAGAGLFVISVMTWPGVADILAKPLFYWAEKLDRSTACLADPTCTAQVIVVPSEGIHPSGYLSEVTWLRLQKGISLWKEGKAPLLLLSAGKGSPEQRRSGAEWMADAAMEMGVPREVILLEKVARSTHDNAVFSYNLLKAQGLTKVFLVTTPLHLVRTDATFRQAGFETIPVRAYSPSSFILSLDYPSWENAGGIYRGLNEYCGLLVYKILGWL
ncbi:MAG: YdcF family protein [Deltaproteobacteria bacterium]|nr:YdcF family protein [Deltaproteobacteria bacterium]MBI4224025.1 YdcF family protein [Deltaproteobacteria bacterium]